MVGNELLFVVLLAALGSGPAAFLPERFDAITRVALCPIFGLAIGVDLFTTTLFIEPADSTSWLLPVVAVISVGFGVVNLWNRRTFGDRKGRLSGSLLGIVQLLMVCAVTAGPVTWTFLDKQSDGPVAYKVPDVVGYVGEIDGAALESLRTAASHVPDGANLMLDFWQQYVRTHQRLDVAPLLANVDALFHEYATTTQSAFLIAIVVLGGLGVFAGVRYFIGRNSFAAVVAGSLFGGALFMQLFFDGSQAALCILVLLVPLFAFTVDLLRRPSPIIAVILALLFSSMISIYPIYVPALVVGLGVVLMVFVLRGIRRQEIESAPLLWVRYVGAIALMSVLFNVVGVTNAFFQLRSGYIGGPPNYGFLVPRVLPSWLFQVRGLYDLAHPSHNPITNAIVAFVIPLLFVVIAWIGIRKYRAVAIAIPPLAGFIALAAYERLHPAAGYPDGCSYCEGRYLLPLGPVLILFIGVGLATLAASTRYSSQIAGLIVGVVLVGSTGAALHKELTLFSRNSYYFSDSVGNVLNRLANTSGSIEEEAFSEAPPNPIAEDSLVYLRIEEQFPGRASQVDDYNENNADLYFQFANAHPFRANYRYVITNIPQVRTDRTLIVRDEEVGLYERSGSLDATVDYGVTVRSPSSGEKDIVTPNIFAREPIRIIVTGDRSDRSVFVRLRFGSTLQQAEVDGVDGSQVAMKTQSSSGTMVCVTTVGHTASRGQQS